MIITIPSSDIKIGMYVVKLNLSWIDTPFLKRSFLIDKMSDLVFISERLDYVDIDTSKSIKSLFKTVSPHSTTIDLTLLESKLVSSQKLLKSIFEDLKRSQIFHQDDMRNLVKNLMSLVYKNDITFDIISEMRHFDDTIYSKSVRVSLLTIIFLKFISINKKSVVDITTGAILHDVGLLKVSNEILQKKSINIAEKNIIELHPLIGKRIILKRIEHSDIVLDIISKHHELLDGSGYPAKLTEKNIPLHVRIVSIISIYEAITRDKVYAERKSKEESIKELVLLAIENKVDAKLVVKLSSMLAVYLKGMSLITYYGEILYYIKKIDENHCLCISKSKQEKKLYNFNSIEKVIHLDEVVFAYS